MKQLKIALDWSPNVIHAGILYALHQGNFEDAGIDLELISTEIDNYTKKPMARLLDGEVDLSIGPTEHLFYFDSLEKQQLQAVATIMQQETSAFVVKSDSGIDRPLQLDGKLYLGYNTPLEKDLLKTMIQKDGGEGAFEMENPPRLSVWSAFEQSKGDVCWVFVPWEGQVARKKGINLNVFKLEDYEVPYGYSSLMYAQKHLSEEKKELIRTFLTIAAEGYKIAAAEPLMAGRFLCRHVDHPNFNDDELIDLAIKNIAPAFLNADDHWGLMSHQKFDAFLNWMHENKHISGEEKKKIESQKLFTNEYLIN